VSEIYKSSVDQGDLDTAAFDADAVRSGARALFFQSLVNIATSIVLPFLVGESGVQLSESHGYEALNGNGHGDIGSATWKRSKEEWEDRGKVRRWVGWTKEVVKGFREEGVTLPIKGLTLVDLWCWSMFLFAGCMMATW
jgi:solute carrier family 45 protein 1/2/4